MGKEGKKVLGALIGGITAVIVGGLCLFIRFILNAVAQELKDDPAQLVELGSAVMLKKDYLEMSANWASVATVAAVICFVIAIVLFVLCFIMNKSKHN